MWVVAFDVAVFVVSGGAQQEVGLGLALLEPGVHLAQVAPAQVGCERTYALTSHAVVEHKTIGDG